MDVDSESLQLKLVELEDDKGNLQLKIVELEESLCEQGEASCTVRVLLSGHVFPVLLPSPHPACSQKLFSRFRCGKFLS